MKEHHFCKIIFRTKIWIRRKSHSIHISEFHFVNKIHLSDSSDQNSKIISILNFDPTIPKKDLPFACSESTKQMEQTLRAKVKIFFKSENLKNAFHKEWWAYRVYIKQTKIWGGCHHLSLVYDASNLSTVYVVK